MKKIILIAVIFVFASCSKSDPAPSPTTEPTPSNGTFTSVTGRVWMDRNLGATRVAQSATDRLAYGDLYQWGRGTDGHEKINWTSVTAGTPVNLTTTTLSSTDTPSNSLFILSSTGLREWRNPQNVNLWQGVNGINNPCPAGFRLPTAAELDAECSAYGIINTNRAYASPFKFTLAGERSNIDGSILGAGDSGYYWTSGFTGAYPNSRFINGSTSFSGSNGGSAKGFCIRCIQN
jgi:hypothetical protein